MKQMLNTVNILTIFNPNISVLFHLSFTVLSSLSLKQLFYFKWWSTFIQTNLQMVLLKFSSTYWCALGFSVTYHYY